jgi:hypothetical protein
VTLRGRNAKRRSLVGNPQRDGLLSNPAKIVVRYDKMTFLSFSGLLYRHFTRLVIRVHHGAPIDPMRLHSGTQTAWGKTILNAWAHKDMPCFPAYGRQFTFFWFDFSQLKFRGCKPIMDSETAIDRSSRSSNSYTKPMPGLNPGLVLVESYLSEQTNT